jgi:phage tail sheath protein FI
MSTTAERAQAVAVMDPPGATVTAAQSGGTAPLTQLAAQFQQSSGASSASAVLLSSGLLDGTTAVPGAPAVAGMVAETDASTGGPWQAPGGLDQPVAGGSSPALTVTDAINGVLQPAGIDAWRVMPGYGTVLYGTRTVAPSGGSIAEQRMMSWLDLSIGQALDSSVFQPNNPTTWDAVISNLSSFLTSVWQRGGLVGATASQAYQVQVGLGSTMTAMDIQNGFMDVTVGVALEQPGEFATLTFQQQMATSG